MAGWTKPVCASTRSTAGAHIASDGFACPKTSPDATDVGGHRVEPTEPVRRLAVALSGDDGGGHEAARPLLQPSVRERGLALGQQIRSWDAPHERLRRHLAKVQPARQVLPRRGAADEEGGVRDQERHVELAEHVEP
jgi:hypothetical protein